MITAAQGGRLARRDARLTTAVNVSQVLTETKSVLHERVGYLAPDRLKDVEAGLRTVMGP